MHFIIFSFIKQGDMDYMRYVKQWEEEGSEKFRIASMEKGLELIKNDQTILHTSDAMLREANRNNPSSFPYVKTISAALSNSYTHSIFTKNSPLVPVFYKASIKTFEQGQYERITRFWQGQEISVLSKNSVDTMILTGGQVFLIFGVLMLSLLSSFICLFFEIVFFNYQTFISKIKKIVLR